MDINRRNNRSPTGAAAVLAFVLIVCGWARPGWEATRHVAPDGSGDAPTIKAALDSSAVGDTVMAACGLYFESGISMKSGVVLSSETGHADCVTIDAEGISPAIECVNCGEPTSIVGITFRNGRGGYETWGGGMFCIGSSQVIVANCAFVDNRVEYGGAVSVDNSSAEFSDCLFRNNFAMSYGGAMLVQNFATVNLTGCVFDSNSTRGLGGGIACWTGTLALANCTLFGNRSDANEHTNEPGGGGVYLYGTTTVSMENTVIASSPGGEGVWCEGQYSIQLVCCDIWGNAHGDWVGGIADQYGVEGNFSKDPLFCDTASGVLTVEGCSPCLPGHHPDGYDCDGPIGAYGSGCDCGDATAPATWGAIKAMYR